MVFPVQLASHLDLLLQTGQTLHSSTLLGPPIKSEMKTNNGEAATAPKTSRKRKMKQVVEAVREPPPPRPSAANLLTLQRQQFPSHLSTALHLNINNQIGQPSQATTSHIVGGQTLPVPSMQYQGIHAGTSSASQPAQSQIHMELSKPVRSFTALLTEDDDKDDINFIIKTHVDQMRRTLSEMSWKHYSTLVLLAEERAAKRLKQKELQVNQMMIKNAELQQMVEQSKQEAQAAQAKVKSLENAVVGLKVSLNEANERGGGGGNNTTTNAGSAGGLQQEDAESSFTDPSRGVEPIRLACKGCDKKVANMMLWPCHHVALCTMCDARAKVCPVCSRAKMMSIELGLP